MAKRYEGVLHNMIEYVIDNFVEDNGLIDQRKIDLTVKSYEEYIMEEMCDKLFDALEKEGYIID